MKLESLTKEQIMAQLEAAYARAKPINDQMVDVSLEVTKLTSEVYRRSILLNLKLEPEPVKSVMTISMNVHPNKGLPELVRRLQGFKEVGIEIVRVTYDENTHEYRFFSKSELPST